MMDSLALTSGRTELRIGMVAEFNQGSTGRAIADGLRFAKVPVTEIQVEAHHFHYASKALRGVGLLAQPLSKISLEVEVLRQVKLANINVIIFVKGTLVRPRLIKILRTMGVRTVLYYPDFHFDHRGLDLNTMKTVDLFCTTKSFQIDYLKQLRGPRPTVLVHHGFIPTIHAPTLPPLKEEDHDFDIFYAGNPSPYKASILNAVAERFPDRLIVIAGNEWNAFSGPLNAHLHGGPIVGTFLSNYHERARINLAMHMGVAGRQGWADLVSTRTFEIPASRGFMLHPDNDDLRTLFDPENEVGTFLNSEAMLDAIARFLGDPDRRIAMRDAAYERAIACHSYYDRALEILSHIHAISNRDSGI